MLRPFVSTRVLIDYDAFNDGLAENVLICTNKGVLGALRVLVRSYGLRDVNWVTAHTDAGYIGVDATQFDNIDNEISIFLGATDNMGFCEDLVLAMQAIADNVGGAGCDCGGAGAGQATEVPSTNQPGVPGNPQPGDAPPPGFADFAEYNPYKCDVAEWIVQQVESDLAWWQNTNFVLLTLAGFVAALLTPIPGDEIVAFLGFLVALALQGVTTAAVGNMIDAVANNRNAILCAMYQAANATASTSNLTSTISDAIDGETTAIYAPILKTILGGMFNANNVNHLYVRWDEKIPALPMGDCSSCACTPTTEIGVDQGGGNWDTAFHAPAVDPPGKNVIKLDFVTTAPSDCEVDQLSITPTNINPTPGGGFKGYQLYDNTHTLIYNDDAVPPLTDGVHQLVIQSNTAGSAIITWTSQ